MYQPSIADVGNGSVSLVLSSATTYGCPPDKDTLTIVFSPIPTADFNSNAVCQGANTVFSDLSTNTSGTITAWEWNFGDTGTSIVQNPSHNYSTNGNIGVSLIVTSNNGCKDTVTKTVTVHPIPTPSFTSPEFCVDAQSQLTNTSFISSGVISSYLYDFGGLGTSTSEDPFFTFNTVGTYSVSLTATSSFGCIGTTTQQVIVNPLPTADFTASPLTALVNQTITFTDQSSGSIQQWLWDFGNGEGDNLPNTSNSFPDGGVYDVTLLVTDQLGCQDEVTKQISIVLLPVLPTGFTPNGDGENDVFIIRGGPFQTVDFKVYNNWGQLIFETTDGNTGWDGTYKGEPAPLGVYTWTFIVDIGDGVIYKESGDVTLMR
jgi:gliding motility-associated-like protein